MTTSNIKGKHIFNNAQVSDNAQVSGNARVFGDARVSGNAQVSGIKRSDGYVFVYVRCVDEEYRVIAGCRYFTMKEAKAHWQARRKGTPLARETMAILKCLEILHKVKPEGMV